MEMRGDIAIPQLEPVIGSQGPQSLQAMKGISVDTPSVLRVGETGQRVGNGVEIGRNVQPVHLRVIRRVSDDPQPLGIDHSGQSIEKPRGADASRQRDDRYTHAGLLWAGSPVM